MLKSFALLFAVASAGVALNAAAVPSSTYVATASSSLLGDAGLDDGGVVSVTVTGGVTYQLQCPAQVVQFRATSSTGYDGGMGPEDTTADFTKDSMPRQVSLRSTETRFWLRPTTAAAMSCYVRKEP